MKIIKLLLFISITLVITSCGARTTSEPAAVYQPEGGKYYLGGISAFRLAANHPQLFHSILAVPGLPRGEADFRGLAQLKDMPVAMFVGEQDTGWIERMQATEAELSRLGGQVSLEIVPNEGHVIQSLSGGEALFDLLESFRRDR